MNIIGFEEAKNETAKKGLIRNNLIHAVMQGILSVRPDITDEDILYIEKPIEFSTEEGTTVKIAGESLVIRTATVTNKDGFQVDAVAVISITVKPWDTKVDSRKRVTSAVNFDDVADAIEACDKKRTEKEQEKAKAKAEKIALDNKRRAEKNAKEIERLQAVNAEIESE